MAMSEAMKKRLLGTSYDREHAPWETYDKALDRTQDYSEQMKTSVAEYETRRHAVTSNQNLEELCRQKEMSNEMVKEHRFYRQAEDDLADNEQLRRGQLMDIFTFWDKLKTIIPCYISSKINKGLAGMAVYKPYEFVENSVTKRVDWQYVCGVQVYWMYEFSVLHFDRHGLPLNEKWRGWRTVLLRLIQKEFITEADADRVFGKAYGPASRRHNEQLYYWRNRKQLDNDLKVVASI